MLGSFTLASWGDLGTLGSTLKDDWRSRLRFVLSFAGFRDPILKVVWLPWTKKGVFVHGCLHVSFWGTWLSPCGFFRSESAILPLKNKRLAREVLQNSTFGEIGFLMILGFILHDFGWPWDNFFMTFVALETGLETDDFSRWFWGHPDLANPPGWGWMFRSRTHVLNNFQPPYRKTILRQATNSYSLTSACHIVWKTSGRWYSRKVIVRILEQRPTMFRHKMHTNIR